MITDILRKIYWKLEKAIVPELRSSQYLYKEKLFSSLPSQRFSWLDLGCGRHVFAEWMTGEQDEFLKRTGRGVGIDLDLGGLKANQGLTSKIYGDLRAIPLRDKSFDVVTANMVVEHLDEPSQVFSEVYRLLRSGGKLVVHTTNAKNPFLRAAALMPQQLKNKVVYFLERRKAEDVFPTHYKVNSPADVEALAAQAGFAVDSIELISTSAFTQMLTPVVLLELFFIRLLRSKRFQHLRTNLIFVLSKPKSTAPQEQE